MFSAMDLHQAFNLALAIFITAALIGVPLLVIVAIRLWSSLPQNRPRNKSLRSQNIKASVCTTTIFLGSGGHTAEMLQLVSGLDTNRYTPRHYVVGWDDNSSAEKVHRLEAYFASKRVNNSSREARSKVNGANNVNSDIISNGDYTVHRIPRSRYVHQSMLTTPFTLAKSLFVAMPMIKRLTCLSRSETLITEDSSAGMHGYSRKSVLLMNGPGTCLALALAVIGARMAGVADELTPDLVFVESFARVKTLSLAGKLLYPLCDTFLVQWPGLVKQYPRSKYNTPYVASKWGLLPSIPHQSFSTSGITSAYAKRTPRPKQRVVKEQKLKAARSASAGLPQSHQSKKGANASGTTSRPWKRVQSTSISVTSLERGSRNPQLEHSFAPGFASSYRSKKARGPPVKTGNPGRDKAAAAERTLIEAGAKRKTGPKVRGFVPVRFALRPIASDVTPNLVSTRKIPAYRNNIKASGSMTAGEEPVFAENKTSVQDVMQQIANTRFQSMGLHPDVEKGIMGFLAKTTGSGKKAIASAVESPELDLTGIKPTEIQALSIPASIDPNKKSPYTLCAAETGSGKTLAYLIPVLHDLKMQEDKAIQAFSNNQNHENIEQEDTKARALGTIRQYNRPRAIILLPSRELVAQVSGILKELSHTIKLRTLALSHSMQPKSVFQRLTSGPVDIVVATPASLLDYLPKDHVQSSDKEPRQPEDEDRKLRGSARLLEDHRLSLDSLRHLVIDEADSMFDRGFGTQVTKIVRQAKAAVSAKDGPVKVTVVSATLPKKVSDTLDETLPGMLKITTPSLHKSLPNLHQTFLDLKPYFGNRPKAILDILAKQQQVQAAVPGGKLRKENTLIFCNTKHSCDILYAHLKDNKVSGLLGVLHGEAENRDEILRQFTDDDYIPPNPAGRKPSEPSMAGGKILISTDIASRGVDTTAVQHVVLYDFPVTIVDYLHRVGRTARGGRGGRATSLVGRKDRNLAERIMIGIRLGQVLS
ncbi:RNA helicase [Linnemannia zychae]|nr:RNA helicase [Linnemannia zychae]